jgi:hypothetical protein
VIRIAHRRNTRQELIDTPYELGVEIDIRSHGQDLALHHDPCMGGENFEDWLDAFQHQILILHTKEEGLEDRLLAMMAERGIENFFFLDQSLPSLIRTAKTGEKRCAVKTSEFESIDTAMTLRGQIEWLWVDGLSQFPLGAEQAQQWQNAGFKLCLASPELLGGDRSEIAQLRQRLASKNIQAEAVCSKRLELWTDGEN